MPKKSKRYIDKVEDEPGKVYEPLELVVKGKDKTVAWACGKCNIVCAASDKPNNETARKIALEHCQPKKGYCETCGVELSQYYYKMCNPCKEKARFEKAEKINFEDWNDDPIFHGDDYYHDWDSFFDTIRDREEDNEEERPKYVYATKRDEWKGLNSGDILESALEEYQCDNYDPVVNDREELDAFLREWNEKQDIVVFWEDPKRVILIPDEVYEKYYAS